MKNFYAFLAVCFSTLMTFVSAQNQHPFIIQYIEGEYEMHLNLDDSNIDSVFIYGFHSNKGDNIRFSEVLTAKEMYKKKNPNTKIHNISNEADYGFYSLTIIDKEGKVQYHPSVKILMPFENAIVKN